MSQATQHILPIGRLQRGLLFLGLLSVVLVFLLPAGILLFQDFRRGRQPGGEIDSATSELSPHGTNWETESFSAAADGQLKLLGKLLVHPAEIHEEQINKLATPAFHCERLRPESLRTIYSDDVLTVSRPEESRAESRESTAGKNENFLRAGFSEAGSVDSGPSTLDSKSNHDHHDISTTTNTQNGLTRSVGLMAALKALAEPFANSATVRVKFKIFRVELAAESGVTLVSFQASARTERGLIQENATWRCRWSRSVDGSPPLLEWISVEHYEESVSNSLQGALFTDCTEAVLGNDFSIRKQLLRGMDQWREQLQIDFAVSLQGHHGIAVGDVNGDDLEDIYVCQPGGVPNRLLVQNLDGTVTDTAADAGVDWLDRSWGTLLLDLDNDGDRDLVVVMDTNILLMANDGTGRFSQRSVYYLKDYAYSLAAADYDNDGNVDIFVTSYGSRYIAATAGEGDDAHDTPSPYHDANNGHRNILLRNDGHWVFSDVTRECGLDHNNRRWSFAAAWEDFDNDGDQDLYVANDFGRNNLYRNDGGHFVDVAATAGVEDIAAGMSASWGDYDGDGLMDLYVGNMFSSAGGRIAYQRRFQTDADSSIRRQFQRHARGNSLFKNAGDGTFRDVSADAAVTMGRWAWSSKFIDINNDGWEDIFVTNGFITGPDTDDL